jgi:citrate synthase
MRNMAKSRDDISGLIIEAARKARREAKGQGSTLSPKRVKWPIPCTVGPGLEGAIACETKIGYVDGTRGQLIYQGYDIFDLCAHSTYEEVCYLLLHGRLPTESQFESFKKRLVASRPLPNTLRRIMSVPVEELSPMAALRMGTNFMRQRLTWRDRDQARPDIAEAIASDEDSIPMETPPKGEARAIYEFRKRKQARPDGVAPPADDASGMHACMHLISGMATIAAAIARLRQDALPIDPDPELSHAANFLYMMTGRRPTPEEERVMDVSLILHADHGMNASTFAAMVVASTMSDIYFSVGAGIAALNGPLHGGANEQVVHQLNAIGNAENVEAWFRKAVRKKRKIMGFGHRVYKAYDPRARVLGPLAVHLARGSKETLPLLRTARALEKLVISEISEEKGVFPNVDFYSGLVYACLDIPPEMFTPIFAVSRVAGWSARVLEYLRKNRIFRPRAWYTGAFDEEYVPMEQRGKNRK